MGIIWWILPALTGVLGLMLSFAGLGRLFKLKLAAGGLRFVFGIGFLGISGVTVLAGLNLQTYQRLTQERDVAFIEFNKVANEDDTYSATLQIVGEDSPRTYMMRGDEFLIGAQVIRFKPMAQMLGYDSVYRLDFLQWQYDELYNTQSPTDVRGQRQALFDNPGIDVYALAKAEGKRFGMDGVRFGSAVYDEMGDGYRYRITITQTALAMEPDNQRTRNRKPRSQE